MKCLPISNHNAVILFMAFLMLIGTTALQAQEEPEYTIEDLGKIASDSHIEPLRINDEGVVIESQYYSSTPGWIFRNGSKEPFPWQGI